MTDIEQVEKHIEDLKKHAERKNLALRLEHIPEFKQLILDGFCEADCARFVRTSTDPSMQPEARMDSLAMAQAAGYLRRWLSTCVQMGIRAEHEIDQHRVELEELRAEGKDQ